MVKYNNQNYTREALFNLRYGMFNDKSKISLAKFKETLMQEEFRLVHLLELDKLGRGK